MKDETMDELVKTMNERRDRYTNEISDILLKLVDETIADCEAKGLPGDEIALVQKAMIGQCIYASLFGAAITTVGLVEDPKNDLPELFKVMMAKAIQVIEQIKKGKIEFIDSDNGDGSVRRDFSFTPADHDEEAPPIVVGEASIPATKN